jgi:DNA-binding response OmpR family regulator
MKLAILDDDPVILESVVTLMTAAGHQCQPFNRSNLLLQALRQENYDMFVLDWNLPDLSGVSVVEWIRNHLGGAVPVLLLTSRSVEEDVVTGLRAGADDYVTKPFRPAVLQARVAALGRRSQTAQSDSPIETFGNYAFDVQKKSVQFDKQDVPLTAKEFQLALLLFRSADRAVSRQHVLETIWGLRADIPTRTLDSHITRLRSKLLLRAENGYQLSSIYGFGYRLEHIFRST